MTVSNTSRRWYLLQLLLAALGAGISLYLLVQHTRLKSGIQGDSSFCNLGSYANCNVVNASQYAEVAGVPLAALGVLYFLCLLVLGAVQPPAGRAFRRFQAWMARLSILALAFDVWLLGVQAFALHSFCLFCLSTYLCTAGHLFANWKLTPREDRDWKSWLKGDRKRIPSMAMAAVVVVMAVSTVGMFQYVFFTVAAAQVASLEQSKKVFLETWDTRPAKSVPIKDTDPVWGNPNARVKVVVFSDFECPHCQRAAFAIHTALAPEENQVALIYKNFPLDNACNPLVPRPLHANACALAHLGYCANRKKKFWDFHDRVFFRLSAREISSSRDALYDGVKNFFSKKEFEECLLNADAQGNTRDDIELGKTLEIESTPTVFINGKRVVAAPTVDLIRELVRKENSRP